MRQIYYKSRQLFIYYKFRQNFITKRISFFIAKKTRRFYGKMRHLLQNASIFTKRGSTVVLHWKSGEPQRSSLPW